MAGPRTCSSTVCPRPCLSVPRPPRFAARLSLLSAAVTVSLFLYVLVLPLIKGEQPNVSNRPLFVPLQPSEAACISTDTGDSLASYPRSSRYVRCTAAACYSSLDCASKVMTTSIVGGWSLLSYTLGRWSSLGYLEGVVAGARFHVRSRCMTRAHRLPNTSVWAVCPRVRSSRTHSRTTGAQALRRGTQTHVLLPQLCIFNTRVPPKLFVPASINWARQPPVRHKRR